ncbi:MAG: ATP-binding protein [Erysipelotrichaceae bacterium]|nr:ATP-binding protein [Erysipelotrichaceae bacterium]MDD3924094.1 ATP-binding protein [Erysipelotrichaceae bacterium]MDD4642262.1 ATP-binding protein [Erysipelotrichaceae bacterium]
MKIAVLSGKGGTGKTLVSVNLATVSGKAVYIDCDVEEPNGHLFFKPVIEDVKKVTVKIPQVDQHLCDGCRKCVDFCRFNALAYVNKQWLLFDEICHSCGGCALVCPLHAITEIDKVIGEVKIGMSDQIKVISGFLNPGEVSGIPIIKQLFKEIVNEQEDILIDCPPGSACIVMESIKDADYCILVAEPTIFGEHNLKMVYELVKLFDKPFGVILNKYQDGFNPSEAFCLKENIKIIGKIPFDQELGTINSNGSLIINESVKYKELFESFLTCIKEEGNI